MKIDNIKNTAFQGIVSMPKPVETKEDLSSPFINYYNPKASINIPKGKNLTAAERNNNPFNIKWGTFASKYGAVRENKNALDGGSFATFPSVDIGLKAAKDLLTSKSYKDLTVDQAMKKWSNKGYGGNIFPEVANKPISSLSNYELDELQKRQVINEDRNFAKKLGYYKYGGKLPKYANGAYLSTGLGLAGEFVGNWDTNPQQVNKEAAVGSGILKGAASGASIGSIVPGWGTAIGAVVGGAIGGITSGINADKRKKALRAAESRRMDQFTNMVNNRSFGFYSQMNPYEYDKGGILTPQYEAEKDEVVQGDAILEDSKPIANGLHLVKGRLHEQGGTLGQGGDRIFSNSIKLSNGKTPAKEALTIGNKLKKFEINLSSKDRIKRQTAELMTDKLNKSLDSVFQEQELMKLPKYKYGGYIKYENGGDLPSKYKTISNRISEIENQLKGKFSNTDIPKALKNELKSLKLQSINVQKSIANKQLLSSSPLNRTDALLQKLQNTGKSITGNLKSLDNVNTLKSLGRTGINTLAIPLGIESAANISNTASKISSGELNMTPSMTGPASIFNKTSNPNNVQYSGTPWNPFSKQYSPILSNGVTNNNVSTIDPISTYKSTNKRIKGSAKTPPVVDNRLDITVNPVQSRQMNTSNSLNRSLSIPKTASNVINNPKYKSPYQKNNINLNNDIIGLGLSGIGYLANNAAINKMNTYVPANLVMNPYYGYADRSRLSRNMLSGNLRSIINNPNFSNVQKQQAFAAYSNALNNINDRENQNKLEYDNSYSNRQFQVEAQNNAILNQAAQQRIANQNAKVSLKAQNTSNLLGNINTLLAEREAKKLDEKKFNTLSNVYSKMYGTNFGIE